VQQPRGDELVPDASASFCMPSEPVDDGGFDESEFEEEITNLCVIVPRPRRLTTVGQVSTIFLVAH
jgi:hypothetical protein